MKHFTLFLEVTHWKEIMYIFYVALLAFIQLTGTFIAHGWKKNATIQCQYALYQILVQIF